MLNFNQIEMLLMDVDGVLTSGDIILGSQNIEIRSFNVLDGMGIMMAIKAELKVGAISGKRSEIVERRLQELNFDQIFLGCTKKLEAYEQIKGNYHFTDNHIAYIGDDILDIPILKKVGFPCAVENSILEVKKIAKYVSKKKGGAGAVREIIDYILVKKGVWDNVVSKLLSECG